MLGNTDTINKHKLRFGDGGGLVTTVTLGNVFVGMRVRRGHHWRKKWRADIITDDPHYSSKRPHEPKARAAGVIIGFVNEDEKLVGEDSLDAMLRIENGTGWSVVRWDNGKGGVYPIGAENVFSLCETSD